MRRELTNTHSKRFFSVLSFPLPRHRLRRCHSLSGEGELKIRAQPKINEVNLIRASECRGQIYLYYAERSRKSTKLTKMFCTLLASPKLFSVLCYLFSVLSTPLFLVHFQAPHACRKHRQYTSQAGGAQYLACRTPPDLCRRYLAVSP